MPAPRSTFSVGMPGGNSWARLGLPVDTWSAPVHFAIIATQEDTMPRLIFDLIATAIAVGLSVAAYAALML